MDSSATKPTLFVARGCSAARLSDTSALLRRPRVRHDTFRRHFSPFSLPKGARQNDVRMNGTPRQRNPHFSSPESKVRHAWVTLPSIFVARECSTTLSGNTSAPFRRPRVQYDTFRRHFSPFSLPKGARQNDVRMKGLFGNETHTFRRPRVKYGTFRRHFRPFLLPVGVGQNDVRIRGTLRQRNPHHSSPDGKVRHWRHLRPFSLPEDVARHA